MTTSTLAHTSATSSYSAIAKAVNAVSAKSVREGKQARIAFSEIHVFHEENCRDALDAKGLEHIKQGVQALINGKPLKTITVTAIKFEDKRGGVKVVDGFHTYEMTKAFIAYLKEQGIKSKKVGNVTYTDDPKTTFLPVDALELDDYAQDVYKLATQNNRKNDPIELITFIDKMQKKHGKTVGEIAKEIGKPESSIKNLMVLLNADADLIELIKADKIKASRAAALMREYMKMNKIDGRKKDTDLSKVDFTPVTKLAQREIDIFEGGEVLAESVAKAVTATTDSPATPAATDAPATPAATDAPDAPAVTPKKRKVTRQALKTQSLKPTEIENLEQLALLLAERTTQDGDIAVIEIPVAIAEQLHKLADAIKEKNEHNKALFSAE